MDSIKSWCQRWTDTLHSLPWLAPWRRYIQERVVLAVCLGGVAGFLLAGVLGAIHRGFGGWLVGGLSGLLAGAVLAGVAAWFWPTGVGEAMLRIEIDADEEPFSPGGVVTGYVHIEAGDRLRTLGGSLTLRCQGSYMYDRPGTSEQPLTFVRNSHDYVLETYRIIPALSLRAGARMRYPFQVPIPDSALPTHRGYGCTIRWTLSAALEGPARATPAEEELTIVSAPRSAPTISDPEARLARTSSAWCDLGLQLGAANFLEGEFVTGRVLVVPRKDLVVSELRVLLLRVENIPSGDNHTVYVTGWDPQTGHFLGQSRPADNGTTYVWLEDETDLREADRLQAGQPREFSFRLQIPRQYRPTLVTNEGSTTWRVGAVLSVDDQADLRAMKEIWVRSGEPSPGRVSRPV